MCSARERGEGKVAEHPVAKRRGTSPSPIPRNSPARRASSRLAKYPRTTTEAMEDWLGWPYGYPRSTTEDIERPVYMGGPVSRVGPKRRLLLSPPFRPPPRNLGCARATQRARHLTRRSPCRRSHLSLGAEGRGLQPVTPPLFAKHPGALRPAQGRLRGGRAEGRHPSPLIILIPFTRGLREGLTAPSPSRAPQGEAEGQAPGLLAKHPPKLSMGSG